MNETFTTGGQLRAAGLGSVLLLAAAVWSQAAPPTAKPAPKLHYNKDIRPILAENCFACHGPDSASRKAGLRLDRFADATMKRGDLAPITPKNVAKSEIILRVTGKGPIMPPAATHKTLTPQQIAVLKQWIAQGAEYETHWAYIPPVRPALPVVKNQTWSRNPIDRFILSELEKNGLQPAPEADRRSLIRRLSLDLTGLPPDPADVDAFVKDKSPKAYENVVDKYLASPRYGEHRARYWLDAARYADSNGIHFDNYREIWSYRDWVINAFNRNERFDQFTIDQLAGDLLPNPTLDQKIATGFNRCNITTNEGGAIDEEYKVLYARDRTETTAQVWLGTTAGCAVCHDHKFDPLLQREFYSLSAYFNNTTQAAMDGNVKDTPPVVPVPMEADRPRFEALKGEIADAKKRTEERKLTARADFDTWLSGGETAKLAAGIPSDGLRFALPLSEGQGKAVLASLDGKPMPLTAGGDSGWDTGFISAKAYVRKADNAIETAQAGDFEKDQAFTAAAWVKLAPGNNGGSILARMDDQHDFRGWDLWVEGNRIGTHIISTWPANALKVVTREAIQPGQWHHVVMTYSGGAKPESVHIYIDGAAKEFDVQANTLQGTIRTTVPFKVGQRNTTSTLTGTAIQDIRLYSKALTAEEAARLAQGTRAAWLVSRGAANLNAQEKEELFNGWLTESDTPYREALAKLTSLESEQRGILMRGTVAHVMNERSEEATAYLLFRGEYDKRRDPVKPITPAFLPPMPPDYPQNRLGFAKWLLLPNHPLTARVTVNRFWQEIFGQGIVRTTGDFGVMGDQPSHPELLDWLAVEFRESGWDMKRLFKTIVMSAAYRQSTLTTADKRLKDPQNRLLSRGPRFRMDAEMVRDTALAASGLLSPKIGGPSVRPYQPPGVWEAVAISGSNTRDYKQDTGESLYRRGLYTFWKRSAPPASLDIFNAPSRETCTVRRERTDTPLQALVTLNDVQYIEAARNLAEHALKSENTETAQIDFMARRLLARPLRPEELAVVTASLSRLTKDYAANAKDAKELIAVGESKADATIAPEKLAAWTMLANQMMNLDEVLNK